jgi:predicted esterase
MSAKPIFSLLIVSHLAILSANIAAEESSFTRAIDLIYHKEGGYALTMDRIAPVANANGAAIVMVMSGRWISRHEFLAPQVADQLPLAATQSILNPTELLTRGYTVFYVVHGAEPTFTIPEIHTQIGAAVRHIRQNAERYDIDPSRLGIMGGSAGGHLALLQGTKPDNEALSTLQAVVAYFPPTDFMNYGVKGGFFIDHMQATEGPNSLQALDLVDIDPDKFLRTKVTDQERLTQHYRDISPYYHITADDPPTLLIHGDADTRVPLQQSQHIAMKFADVGVPYKLHIKEGSAHGWKPEMGELVLIADWFDTYLNSVRSP